MSTFDAKKDFSEDVKLAVPEARSLAQSKSLDEAIAYLLPLEKKCRVNNDQNSLRDVCVHMVTLCREMNDWEKLNAVLALINKRSAQYKAPLLAVVELAKTYVEETPTLETKIKLLKALKEVCEGKIYVEGESAHLHFALAKIYEQEGDVALACETVQDVHVETYGSLTKLQKATYILEQIRLTLLKKDYIRTAIQSRKINKKFLEEDGFEDVRIRYYSMQIEYYMHERNAWEICQAYYQICTTKPTTLMEESKWQQLKMEALESCILFLVISKYDEQQQDMLQQMKTSLTQSSAALSKDMKGLPPAFRFVLQLFTTPEIISAPFAGQDQLEAHPGLAKTALDADAARAHFVQQFRERIVEHNLRVVAKYYTRVRLVRLQQLLHLHVDELERYLSELSFHGQLTLKIDRPAGIVSFQQRKAPEEVLSDWSGDIQKLLTLMEETCHLINRENMAHKVA